MDKVLEYFSNDAMASDSWKGKYQMKDKNDQPLEETPTDMHKRLAKEFGRIEFSYVQQEYRNTHHQYNSGGFEKGAIITDSSRIDNLSDFGKNLFNRRLTESKEQIIEEIFSYFDKFSRIVPQGSIMSNLGNDFVFGSLSNCFVVASPEDSYGGILKADEELVQLMKRRGGVGTTLNNLRPVMANVTNSARSSTGVPSFAERYSNSTREVAQDGRRGALMLLLSVEHPDIFKFITMKADRTKVTGANISVMFTDKFLEAVEQERDFYCVFPIDKAKIVNESFVINENESTYNQLTTLRFADGTSGYIMRIKARELFDEFVTMAWDNAEPGAAYIDTIQDYSPDGVYEQYKPTKCNPCGEIWMGDYDACRLIAQNFFSAVKGAFLPYAEIDFERLYETSYIQQRLSDNLIDLEVEYIQRILDKIESDPEKDDIKYREHQLWTKIQKITREGRRTGNGFTALGDMLAALGLRYGSPEGNKIVEQVMQTKMRAELDCTIDLAILRGTFEGWNPDLEYTWTKEKDLGGGDKSYQVEGANSFFQMILDEFPEQADRMYNYGRRNVSWSTVAPTGTVSVVTQTTSGIEPLFKAYYIRRKKINPNDENVRIDYTDQNGDNWQEYSILHPKFKDWVIVKYGVDFSTLESEWDKAMLEGAFKESPWFKSEADDVSFEERIELQSIVQRYTSNAISSTLNLPANVSKETVYNIYMQAWKKGLKGVTIYREGSRTGVLITDHNKLTNCDDFGYTDAIKRPKELDADFHHVVYKGQRFAVVVGKLNNNPYEVFAYENPDERIDKVGKIVKVRTGVYRFEGLNSYVENLQLSEHPDERLLTRFVSQLLRHGVNPKYIAEQVEKSEIGVVSFGKVISRVLKSYIPNEAITGEHCPNCGESAIVYQEGCKKCYSCGHSKC